jgi:hypothetical protein
MPVINNEGNAEALAIRVRVSAPGQDRVRPGAHP